MLQLQTRTPKIFLVVIYLISWYQINIGFMVLNFGVMVK
nr:p5 protein [Cucurbit yellow stunting disorder virus]